MFLLERISITHPDLPLPSTYLSNHLTSLTRYCIHPPMENLLCIKMITALRNNWKEDRRNLQYIVMYFSKDSQFLSQFYFCNSPILLRVTINPVKELYFPASLAVRSGHIQSDVRRACKQLSFLIPFALSPFWLTGMDHSQLEGHTLEDGRLHQPGSPNRPKVLPTRATASNCCMFEVLYNFGLFMLQKLPLS